MSQSRKSQQTGGSKTSKKKDVPLGLQKGKTEKKDPALSKLESGFGGLSKNFEESQRASVRAKNAEIAEKMKELKHQK